MLRRVSPPTESENELDISKSLFHGGNCSDGSELSEAYNRPAKRPKLAQTLDASTILNSDTDNGSDGGGDEAFIAAQQTASNRKASNLKGRTVKRGGGFQAMGLNLKLLKAITRKGFSVPTPIQRKTIPLALDCRDVVGMARTGSGKTAAFVIPMIEKLKAHSAKVGARAMIMSPSRELALQTLKVVKELGRGTDLKCVLLVGGDSLEDQFGFMATNPDIIIATPGRFLHLKVEMSLDLSSIRFVVFDEADRLFEMGFAAQLAEILHALPSSRQTLLFSATLPKSLVEFARAGLQEPSLVRLDAESKISPDLESAFLTVKSAEKEGALLHLLHDIIKIPTGMPEAADKTKEGTNDQKKRKRVSEILGAKESPTAHSTIVFVATKHQVDYLTSLLRRSGFAVSYAYGALDQVARRNQVQDFRTGQTNILVVTDVAARGIDIPVLANVVNYDFPPQPKIFVHRVGRTARAGQRGWSYSLVRDSDCPYLLDLQLFLGRRLVLGHDSDDKVNFAEDVVVGCLVRDHVERSCEWVTKLLGEDLDFAALRSVAAKGEKLYLRTRNAASSESAKRSKDVVNSKSWMALSPLFKGCVDDAETERAKMLARVSGFRPQETVFEIGKRGSRAEAAEIMRKRREKVIVQSKEGDSSNKMQFTEGGGGGYSSPQTYGDTEIITAKDNADMDSASEGELDITFSRPNSTKGKTRKDFWKDSEHYMAYTPTSINLAEDRGYGVHSGGSGSKNFLEAARGATMDLNNDDGAKSFAEPSKPRGVRWDKKNKKYVARANDEDGSKGAKMIRGEGGQMIAASFRSGRFDAWRKSHKIDRLPRTGEAEAASSTTDRIHLSGGSRFKHKLERAPKNPDKFRDDFYRKRKRLEEAKENRIGKFKNGVGKRELKSADDVCKERQLKGRRKEKNARPSKKGKY
ncbi:ATP-dependent RNA helicase dbp10 [Glutinoglossum americanum]|uniref:RNA helicase n=1 Tax=Glutinoglossum americanum TaxID=1670608 RepID=A0A9P8L1D3_9PEZI|nr:ATP-dependent RNA helicase dbp10 [Glutinoglossum americanum]